MVNIIITPAHSGQDGSLQATGHAGNDLLCNTITAICECLAVNLDQCWDVRLRRRDNPGDYELIWNKDKRTSRGLERANRAAGFAYNGLKALAQAYPEALKVQWNRVMAGRERADKQCLSLHGRADSQRNRKEEKA
jgi:uncharacterized protein YsxB (DUF464 family)